MSATLIAVDARYVLFERLKAGSGRMHGYRPATRAQLDALDTDGMLLYANRRYGNTYAIDRPTSGAFTLWHGSSRHIAGSLAEGASGVVLAALAHLPDLLFQRDLALLQRGVDTTQHMLDQLHGPGAKVDLLTAMTRKQLEQSL